MGASRPAAVPTAPGTQTAARRPPATSRVASRRATPEQPVEPHAYRPPATLTVLRRLSAHEPRAGPRPGPRHGVARRTPRPVVACGDGGARCHTTDASHRRFGPRRRPTRLSPQRELCRGHPTPRAPQRGRRAHRPGSGQRPVASRPLPSPPRRRRGGGCPHPTPLDPLAAMRPTGPAVRAARITPDAR